VQEPAPQALGWYILVVLFMKLVLMIGMLVLGDSLQGSSASIMLMKVGRSGQAVQAGAGWLPMVLGLQG
jgi:hypothetical protein